MPRKNAKQRRKERKAKIESTAAKRFDTDSAVEERKKLDGLLAALSGLLLQPLGVLNMCVVMAVCVSVCLVLLFISVIFLARGNSISCFSDLCYFIIPAVCFSFC